MNMPKQQKVHRITIIAGVMSCLSYLYLAINSQEYGQATLSQMLSVCFFCSAACGVVWWSHHHAQQDISVKTMLSFALLFRAIGFFAFPVLEDDIYRYLWDGRQTIVNGNPYIQEPADFFDSDNLSDRFENILNRINYPYVATVYGPSSQWIFAAAYLISPGEVWPLQLIFIAADLALIALLMKIAKPNAVLLYTWCPLVIKEFAFTAHPDIFGAFLMVCALRAYLNKRNVLVGVLMATACGIKIFPLMILPFLLKFNWRGWCAFIITAIVIALPFGIQQAWLPEGLKVMSGDWFFNAPLYAAYNQLIPREYPVIILKILLLLSFALFCAVVLIKDFSNHYLKAYSLDIPRGDILFGLMLVCLPALNPWYAIWLLPFCAIRPSVWAWVAATVLLLSYISGINLSDNTIGPYEIPNWVLITEFGIIAMVLIAELLIRCKKLA